MTGLVRSCACVLGHCICHCLGRSSSEQFGRHHCCSLRSAGIVQLATFDVLGLLDQKGVFQSGEESDPATGRTIRLEGGMKRWVRGFKQNILLNSFLLFIFLGLLTTGYFRDLLLYRRHDRLVREWCYVNL